MSAHPVEDDRLAMAWRRLTAAVVVVLSAAPSTATAQPRSRIVVGFERSLGVAAQRAHMQRAGAEFEAVLPRLRAGTALVERGERDRVLAALRTLPAVSFAELDRTVRLVEPRIGPRVRIARAPDDRGFDDQHALYQPSDHDIDATNAWDRRTTCAKIAVADTGVDLEHPDLRSNLWHNKGELDGNEMDDDGNGYVDDYYGVDLVRGRGSGGDDHGHGTHVAGIIGARGNNRRGIAGVCWRAEIVPIKFIDVHGLGTTSGAARAIAYAIGVGAHVINASYSTASDTQILRRAINDAAARNVLVVVAAGNEGRDVADAPRYPASFGNANLISVGASTAQDRLAAFSNFDRAAVDLVAPGVRVLSTWTRNRYRELSGTSMATGFVSAAAALLRAHRHPDLQTLRAMLLGAVDRSSALRTRVASGGRLNVRRSLDAP